MSVWDLYQLIPDFKGLCLLFYEKWAYSMRQIFVRRMGFVKLGFYNPDKDVTPIVDPTDLRIDDVHHGYSLQKMASLFEDLFGVYVMRLFNYAPQWKQIRDALLDHEIGEVEIGDLTDDGTSDLELKDRLELEAYENYLRGFPNDIHTLHLEEFKTVQRGGDITKCFDKAEFILMNGFLHHFGVDGSMAYKDGAWHLSEQDRYYRERTGSDRPTDNLYAHFLDITRENPFRPFFMGIIEAMFEMEFGGVPDCVRQFY